MNDQTSSGGEAAASAASAASTLTSTAKTSMTSATTNGNGNGGNGRELTAASLLANRPKLNNAELSMLRSSLGSTTSIVDRMTTITPLPLNTNRMMSGSNSISPSSLSIKQNIMNKLNQMPSPSPCCFSSRNYCSSSFLPPISSRINFVENYYCYLPIATTVTTTTSTAYLPPPMSGRSSTVIRSLFLDSNDVDFDFEPLNEEKSGGCGGGGSVDDDDFDGGGCIDDPENWSLGSFQSSNKCFICSLELLQTDANIVLSCLHKYHFDCIKDNLLQKNFCPLCRLEKFNSDEIEDVNENSENNDEKKITATNPADNNSSKQQQQQQQQQKQQVKDEESVEQKQPTKEA